LVSCRQEKWGHPAGWEPDRTHRWTPDGSILGMFPPSDAGPRKRPTTAPQPPPRLSTASSSSGTVALTTGSDFLLDFKGRRLVPTPPDVRLRDTAVPDAGGAIRAHHGCPSSVSKSRPIRHGGFFRKGSWRCSADESSPDDGSASAGRTDIATHLSGSPPDQVRVAISIKF
jgi:hypothetical protein